jgi:hypothetical protein
MALHTDMHSHGSLGASTAKRIRRVGWEEKMERGEVYCISLRGLSTPRMRAVGPSF